MINKNIASENRKNADGFSLIEVVIAMVIFLVAILGVFAAFTFAVTFNSGNSKRSQALSVLQREVELMRSAKFTPTFVDLSLDGGVQAARNYVNVPDGNTYRIEITVDDDPYTNGVQINTAKTVKEVTILVTPIASNGSWVTAYQTRSVLIRSRAN